jgi:hypothetical protein
MGRARDWPTLHRDVVFGRAGGRVIWQPRILAWFTDRAFDGRPLPERYAGMTPYDVYRDLDCSARLYEYNSCFRRIEDPRVHVQSVEEDGVTTTTIDTPAGRQLCVTRKTPNSWHAITDRREVVTREELLVAAWREAHTEWRWDPARYDELQADVGDLGAPTMFMPRMNVQSLYIEKMGVEPAIYALYDWPREVEAYFAALEESHNRLIDVIAESPVEIINFGENVHAGTLSPELFERYHLPACQRRCERLRAAGKFTSSHWDGDTGPLLPYARDTGLDSIEAITPRPQGDVTLEQVREALGDEMFLLDGIPAVYFDDTFSESVLAECVHRLLELFAPRLVLGISDEISSTGDLERVRLVGRIVDEYNDRLAA